MVLESLKLSGHEVVVAHDGGEACVGSERRRRSEVIILDIGLPDADGRDVCQALRAPGQSVPVIFLTAYGAMHDRSSGFSAGGDDYLPKPFEVKELIARVLGAGQPRPARPRSQPRDSCWTPPALDQRRWNSACRLTPTEFRMLAAMTSRPGEVVRRRYRGRCRMAGRR